VLECLGIECGAVFEDAEDGLNDFSGDMADGDFVGLASQGC
jgi:hypothetical protein